MSDLDNFKKRVAETIADTKPARVANGSMWRSRMRSITGDNRLKYRKRTYIVPDDWTRQDCTDFWNESLKEEITCPRCEKNDIWINHFEYCKLQSDGDNIEL